MPSRQSDPLLRRLPGEIPIAFRRLAPDEQSWRGRVFLVTYILCDGPSSGARTAFAWHVALTADPESCADNRRLVAEIGDASIAEGLDHIGVR
jgi:hypothetical protein